MATIVTYNDVILRNVTTREWTQEIVYDPSNTDAIAQKFRLTFEAIVHGSAPTLLGAYGSEQHQGGISAKEVYQTISRRLWEPRHTLIVYVGADSISPSSERLLEVHPYNPNDSTSQVEMDVANGPRPISVKITHIASDRVFRVEFTIECSIVLCRSGIKPAAAGHVLNNRWKLEEVMDDKFFTTRIISGRLRLASGLVPGHMMKYLIVPPLEAGFRREALRYVVTEDGLDCEYEVRDRQVHTAAPWPAVDIQGTHTESTNDGVTFMAEMSVRLEGSPEADKGLLIQRLVQIVDSRLKVTSYEGQTPPYFIRQAAIVEHIGAANVVEMRMTLQRIPTSGPSTVSAPFDVAEYLTRVATETLAQPLALPSLEGIDYDPRVSRLPALYGYDPQTGERLPTAALLALHCYLQTPCSPGANSHGISQYQTTSEPGEPQQRTDISGSTTPEPIPSSEGDSKYSQDTREAVITYYEAQNTYRKRPIRVQAPYAMQAADNEDTCKVFSLGSPQVVREVRIEAERIGKWPPLPEPKDTFSNGQLKGWLLAHEEHAQPPALTADGRYNIYKMQALYIWAMNRFPRRGEPSNIGVLAFTNFEQSETAIVRDNIYDERLTP